jgi:hypothetical protein
MNIHWFGWSGWRWLLILEGLPAIVAGAWVFFYLTDRPKNAKWLTVEERDWITTRTGKAEPSLERTGQGLARIFPTPRAGIDGNLVLQPVRRQRISPVAAQDCSEDVGI